MSSNPRLEELADALQALSLEEQQELRELLAQRLPQESEREQRFWQSLLNCGLISELKPRHSPISDGPRHPRIDVPGKPLSESIIEDRR